MQQSRGVGVFLPPCSRREQAPGTHLRSEPAQGTAHGGHEPSASDPGSCPRPRSPGGSSLRGLAARPPQSPPRVRFLVSTKWRCYCHLTVLCEAQVRRHLYLSAVLLVSKCSVNLSPRKSQAPSSEHFGFYSLFVYPSVYLSITDVCSKKSFLSCPQEETRGKGAESGRRLRMRPRGGLCTSWHLGNHTPQPL